MKPAVADVVTILFSLDDQLLSIARQIVIGEFGRFEYEVLVFDGRLIEVPRIGTRQTAVFNSNAVTSLQQVVQPRFCESVCNTGTG